MSKQNGVQSSAKQAQKPSQLNWYVYLVRAANTALYCGVTTDPQRRFQQHLNGKGARFFQSSPAQALVYVELCDGKSSALKREYAIKQLPKLAKESLLSAEHNLLLEQAKQAATVK